MITDAVRDAAVELALRAPLTRRAYLGRLASEIARRLDRDPHGPNAAMLREALAEARERLAPERDDLRDRT